MAAIQPNLLPTYSEKTLGAMKAQRTVKRITFDPADASPESTIYVTVPKLKENEVIVPGSLTLVFEIDLAGGHANNYLVQNVSRALFDKLIVKYEGNILQDTVGYDIFKSGRTFSFHRRSGTTCCVRASRQRPSARSARTPATRTPRTQRKPNWRRLTAKPTVSASTTRS